MIGFDANHVLGGQAFDPSSRELLGGAAREHFKRPVEIVIENTAAQRGTSTIAQTEVIERKARSDAARRAVLDHPLVVAAIEMLGAEVKDVRLAQELAES